MGELALSYARHFLSAFADKCENPAETKRDWQSSPTAWTNRMLGRDNGVLSLAARGWMREHFDGQPHQIFFERRKVDLLGALGSTTDLWATVPVLLVEHENAHDIEVETWNLACWRVRLRVLVFYSDETDRSDKFARIHNVLSKIDDENPPCGEFLLLTAPWRFGSGLTWKGWHWRDRAIKELETP